jgi:hypothetical protein
MATFEFMLGEIETERNTQLFIFNLTTGPLVNSRHECGLPNAQFGTTFPAGFTIHIRKSESVTLFESVVSVDCQVDVRL